MTDTLNALSAGSLILVTVANGYIGSNVVDCLLQLGFKVRGTIRTPKPWLDQPFQRNYRINSFQSVVIPSLENEAAVNDAMTGVSGVMHVASDDSFEKNPALVIGRVVNSAKGVLSGAAKHPSVKPFVMTSSSAAAIIPKPDEIGRRVDQESWNDASIEAAWDPNTPVALLRQMQPDNENIPDPPADEGHNLTEVVDAPRAEALLKEYFGQVGWTSLGESLRAAVSGY